MLRLFSVNFLYIENKVHSVLIFRQQHLFKISFPYEIREENQVTLYVSVPGFPLTWLLLCLSRGQLRVDHHTCTGLMYMVFNKVWKQALRVSQLSQKLFYPRPFVFLAFYKLLIFTKRSQLGFWLSACSILTNLWRVIALIVIFLAWCKLGIFVHVFRQISFIFQYNFSYIYFCILDEFWSSDNYLIF